MKITPEEVDALLPQTQCGLCGYGGCKPYAEAMVFEKAPIHLCPPGGIQTLISLGELLNRDPKPYIPELEKKIKPDQIAFIREAECIGCTKCIQACPVDAIIGAAKEMHTIITAECTGCELCVPPCPVDCIDMLASETSLKLSEQDVAHRRSRFYAKKVRDRKAKREKVSLSASEQNITKKRNYIDEAIARVKAKKLKNVF